ncbi:putative Ig domain-containing protein [Stenotrophomonas maltophilia]|uniref:putative Ig domain-containing protein n=1 Tax=Stenotrophomonas maltophilia TaxID=40324 RepID=UPI0015DFE0AF|nr:putative Ig domain-containing protein [Stenotrophomonas maltophilia]MBA0448028.1 autotransporter domain-containing protein [Stenotrophomonas maltophilia]
MWHAESMHRDAMRYGLVRRFWGHLGAMLLLGISLALPDIARAACTTFTPVNASAGAPMAAGSTITIDASSCQGVAGFGIGSVTTPASNGTATVTSHAASRISYAHSGNGSTTDTFAFDDGTGTNNVLVTVHIQAAASPITILPATVPPATVGTPYAGASFSASGGVAPYTYTVPPGTLPNGMTLSSSGSLSGTPTAQGTFAFSVTASDSTAGTPLTGTASYSITVAAPTITVTNTPTPAVINSPYTFALAASGGNGPYTYSLDAGTSLPPGLVLAGNGTISGMPTALGLTSFTVRVTDSSTPTPFFAPANLSINVQNVVPPVAGAVSATVAHGSSNNPITLSLSGGAATSVAVAAQATHGTATASGTTISYTPTASYSGPDSFTYTATNAGGTSAPATVTITVSPATISYAPSSPAAGTVGVAYSQSLAGASGGTAPYTYVITSGSLPPGITLASNGTLSGTASANGTFNFTVRATDSSTGTGPFSATSGPLTLTIAAATLTYAPTNPPTATVGVAYSQSLASVSGGVAPYTYAIASGSLPLGITLASNGTLSGTPSAGGSFNFTVTVTDNSGGSGPVSATSGPLLLTVNAPTITITPPTLPTVSAGVAYNQNLTAAGGSGAYTYAVTAGALPPGVSLSAAGVISGTATAAGTFPLTITATDSSGGSGPYTGSQPYTLNVTAPSLTLTPTAGALSGTAGAPLNVPFSAGNGTAPYTFDISAGALPNGVTLSPTGTLSGSPTVSGLFTFSVRVTDSTTGTGAPFRRTQNYVLSIAAPTITVLPASLPPPLAGVAYSQTITASSGQPTTFTYAVSAGQVPVGLSLNAATGELSGTPTQAGPYNFTVTATDGGGFTGSQAYSGAVGAPVLSLAPSTVAGTTAGTPYSTTFVASGGNPGYSYQLTGTLPNGLSFSPAGMLSGTPTQAGTFNFSVRASDSTTGTGAPFFIVNNYTLSVSAPTVVVDPTTLPAATGGVAYSQAITASGGNGTYTFSLTSGALPVGMSFSSAGVLSGTPTVAGTFTFTVQATDGNGFTGSRSYSLVVNAPTITLAPTTLPGGSGGVAYSQALTANGGVASYTYSLSAGALPPGIALSSAGNLSGTPTISGNFNFTVTATDSVGFTGSQAYAFSVAAPTITITPATLPAATGSIAYSQPLSASGGNGGYTYSLTTGTLPPGIALSSAGVISGTPTTTGSYSFTVRATDGFGFTGSQAYTVTVNAPAIVFVQTTLPGGQVAVAYSQTVSAGGGSGSFTYSVSAGALPPGIALSSAGVLSGTPTAPGSYSFTLTATDSFGFTGSQPFTVAINQPVPVVVNDAATTPANAPASIDVTANDTGPITSIAIAQAPSHGTATVNGLNVAYTPGSNFFGNDSFTYTATGPGGTSAPATVSISVTPLAVPVAAAQSATVLAGQSVTVQAEAGAINGPFTAVTISRAPSSGTAVVQGASIVYSADADASGVVDFEYTLSNPFGASAPARISVTVNPRPVASALTATAIAGREVKVDLTSTARGGPFTAAAVVSVSPADAGNATITASGAGYTLAFTSAATFGGAVRITYTLSNAYATSAPGTVDVMVKPRSDPSRDAEVLGVLEAQAEGARRMAIGQINNFQRRLESLRAGGGSAGFSNGITFSSASSQRRTQQDDLLRKGIGASGEGLSMIEAPAVQGDATPAATPSDGFAFWTGGAVNFGKLKPGASSDGIDFTTSGISLGADRQIGPSLTLGAGLGYGHDASDIGRNGSRSTVDGYSVATYGSFHPEGGFYVDGLLGYQWLKFDARRFITDNGNTAHGSRDGTQWFASFSTGYQHRSDALLLTPYGRLDLARATLDGYREHGDEVYALDYQRQTVNTSTATAGVLAQWLVKRDYGMWTPQLRAEFGHDMQGSSQAFMRYVDLMSGPVYRATLDRQSRNHTLLGAGIGLQTLKGWTLRAEYQNQLDSSSRDNQGIQISVQKTLPP